MPNWLNIKCWLATVCVASSLLLVGNVYGQDMEAARQAAAAAQAAILAPDLFEEAEENRADAEKYRGNKADRSAAAEAAAFDFYTQAKKLAELRATRLASALRARSLALRAGANNQGNKLWQQAEEFLEDAVAALDRDRDEAARRNGEFATQYYDAAELEALQDGTLRVAREKLIAADKLRAQRYAPVTLQRGRDSAAQAKALLEQDRTAVRPAQTLSALAAAYAERAIQITELAKEKPTLESVILEWDARLEQAERAAGKPPLDTLDPEVRTDALTDEIERLRQQETELSHQLAESQKFIAALEDEIRELDVKLGGASAERRDLIIKVEAQARSNEQLEQAKALFSPEEARVFSQSSEIVVRLIGLKFASGSSEIDSGSEALMQKLQQLVNIYPNSRLLVEGHTDSQGSESTNERLSQARADSVLNRLVGQMRVPAHRISAIGYGESRPIANNETENGRAKNRRIDLIITPAAPTGQM